MRALHCVDDARLASDYQCHTRGPNTSLFTTAGAIAIMIDDTLYVMCSDELDTHMTTLHKSLAVFRKTKSLLNIEFVGYPDAGWEDSKCQQATIKPVVPAEQHSTLQHHN